MNVFEFLGLAANHRKHPVQLVKNFEEVPASKVTWPLFGQVKKDGVYGMLVVGPEGSAIFGRTGKMLTNCERLVAEHSHLPMGVYIGEVCLPGHSLEVLSGLVNPNRTNELAEELGYAWRMGGCIYFHDYLSLLEFTDGVSERPYMDRLRTLGDLKLQPLMPVPLNNEEEAEIYAQAIIERGGEGAVFKQNVGWVAGHKGWRSMKRVRRIEYDLLCLYAEEGKGKYSGKVGNLFFQWRDGEKIKAMLGKDYSHEDARLMWEAFDRKATDGTDPVGKIFRVYGLQDSSKGKIRLPKVGEARIDKDVPDF